MAAPIGANSAETLLIQLVTTTVMLLLPPLNISSSMNGCSSQNSTTKSAMTAGAELVSSIIRESR